MSSPSENISDSPRNFFNRSRGKKKNVGGYKPSIPITSNFINPHSVEPTHNFNPNLRVKQKVKGYGLGDPEFSDIRLKEIKLEKLSKNENANQVEKEEDQVSSEMSDFGVHRDNSLLNIDKKVTTPSMGLRGGMDEKKGEKDD